mgnify:CR=1 FL=1
MIDCARWNHNHTMQHRTDRKMTCGYERHKLERATKVANSQHRFLMLAICTLDEPIVRRCHIHTLRMSYECFVMIMKMSLELPPQRLILNRFCY